MISVMFVDDEALMLERLSHLMRGEESEFVTVACDKTAEEALRHFEENRPDVVVLDISIPEMDGLEIARRIRSLEPSTSIVFLTSYENFDYARQAVEIGVATYLLKHNLTKQGLLATLREAAHQKRRDESRNRAQLRQALYEFAGGKKLAAEELDLVGRDEAAAYALAFVVYPPGLPQQKMADIIRRSPDQQDVHVLEAVNTSEQITVVLMQLESKHDTGHRSQCVLSYVSGLRHQLKSLLGGNVYAVCSRTGRRLNTLWEDCRKCMRLAEHWKFFGEERTVYMGDYAHHICEDDINSIAHYDEDALYQQILGATDARSLRNVFEPMHGELVSGCWNLHSLRRLEVTLQLILEKFTVNNELAALLERVEMQNELEHLTAKEMLMWFITQFIELKPFTIEIYPENVRNILRELHLHFGGNVTLRQLAASVGLSEAHTRVLLKNETGHNYLEHLTRYRMEVAKSLLRRRSDLHIYDIAEHVGYHDIAYFSQLFKKTTGSYPVEFRTHFQEAGI